MKAQQIPKHYSMTCTDEEFREIIMGLRVYEREFHVPEIIPDIRGAMEEAYQGELGEPPGEPLEDVA